MTAEAKAKQEEKAQKDKEAAIEDKKKAAAVAAAEAIPTSRGHRLGGNSSRNKSRLLDDLKQIQHGGGYRLGGGGSNSKESSLCSCSRLTILESLCNVQTETQALE